MDDGTCKKCGARQPTPEEFEAARSALAYGVTRCPYHHEAPTAQILTAVFEDVDDAELWDDYLRAMVGRTSAAVAWAGELLKSHAVGSGALAVAELTPEQVARAVLAIDTAMHALEKVMRQIEDEGATRNAKTKGVN